MSTRAPEAPAKGSGLVLLTLAAGQFLMTLNSSVMNVSIATVAKDVGTTVTGVLLWVEPKCKIWRLSSTHVSPGVSPPASTRQDSGDLAGFGT